MSEDPRVGKSMSKEPKSKSRVKIHLPPRKSSRGGGGASQNVHALDCGVDDFHPPARAKGGWCFAKYKFAQSKDKTRKHKYTHLYIKRTVRVTGKITLHNNKRRKCTCTLRTKAKKDTNFFPKR